MTHADRQTYKQTETFSNTHVQTNTYRAYTQRQTDSQSHIIIIKLIMPREVVPCNKPTRLRC